MIKVSVIVPAYNVQRYVEQCIKSIQIQTLKEIEIIIVNDGSTDKTKDIVESLSKDDPRIKVINKKNQGLLAARGTGIKACKGKYVINIDSDDWIEKTCLEEMYNSLEDTNADMVMCDFSECYFNKKLIGVTGEFKELNTEEYIKRFLTGKVSCYIWTRMIKRQLFEDIDFNTGISLGEDTYLNIMLMNKVKTVVKVDKPLINYRVRVGSLSNKYDESIYEIWNIISILKGEDFKRIDSQYSDELEMFIYNHVFIGRILDKVDFDKRIHRNMYEMYKEQNINIYKNKYFKKSVSIKHKILTYAFLINYNFGIRVSNIIRQIQRGISKNRNLEVYQ